jgi:DNA invertase Pin-like site-specific DNA recombinase
MTVTKKKVCLYARVSTDQHATGLESQVRALKIYCEHNSITEFEIYTDENISGAKESRPSFNRLMADVEADQVSQVVCFSFSRFARSTTHLLKDLQKFKDKGVLFVSLSEKVDTGSAMGMAIFTILGAISQLERELIAERVRNGLANARAKGKILGRKKMRNSVLIRELLKRGLSYRAIATISKASHGSVHAEKKAMLAEEALLAKQKEQDELKIQNAKSENYVLIAKVLEKKSPAVIFLEAA